MGKNQQSFGTRVIIVDKVFLLASDCANELGYNSINAFMDDNPGITKSLKGFPKLVDEEDYNKLLVERPEAFNTQGHIEITKVSTLKAKVDSFRGMYGLKYMIAGPMLKAKAKEKGCESVEEYLERYDYPEEAARILRELQAEQEFTKEYDTDASFIRNPRIFNPENMEKYGIAVQCFTFLNEDRIRLYAFIAGDGFFYELGLGGDSYELFVDPDGNLVDDEDEAGQLLCSGEELFFKMYVNEAGELCIPRFDDDTGEIIPQNIGKTVISRDFKRYSVFENVIWVVQNINGEKEWVDSITYDAPGIYASLDDDIILDLILHSYHNNILIEGIVECDYNTHITNITGLPVFSHEVT